MSLAKVMPTRVQVAGVLARWPQVARLPGGQRCLKREFTTLTAELPMWKAVPEVSIAQRLSDMIAQRPVLVAMLTCAGKAFIADLIVQVCINKKEVDQKRSLLFLSFGGLFQGGFQFFLWNVVFERLFPGASAAASLSKLAATNFVADPLFFFPTFYTMKEAMDGDSSGLGTVTAALSKYKANCMQDLTMSWTFWLPGHYVTYFLLPLHLRVPWAACASFGYLCVLSALRGGGAEP
ncbi:unnamed protein product [Effrenium voratum]|nr:unnamed protein product [Effrenium voratum]|mmetsp:Transcript_5428/g.12805  ORF Transcript_5428/g.12805 Transcript_5428/m.12805 type:complete len:236 (-) Transcript_5428:57-764(-)|eukprot:CAMPEP_0181412874 /NCGR_PEP_ID=MMETSP1110-20121109/8660_1 /TAXON_ID=174948 /ORGANISM="Symbiodinium sp., Strain CCMP421" /LENGTH=235 /DNA_ID=CAMNT_0023535627 /DNA_START=34 /DNA_END=741 /DNA_ORIENTATION=+